MMDAAQRRQVMLDRMEHGSPWTGSNQRYSEILLAALTVAPLVAALVAVVEALRRNPFQVSADVSAYHLLVSGSSTLQTARVTQTVAAPSVGAALLHQAGFVVLMLVAAAVAWQLQRLARSLRVTNAFTTENVQRVRAIAVLVLVGGLAWTGVGGLVQLYESAQVFAAGVPGVGSRLAGGATFTWLPFAAFWPLMVLAEVFRRGAQLRADVDGLV